MENHFGEFTRYIQIPYIYKNIAMNKKQCLATKYQKTKIKPNKIRMLASLIEKKWATSFFAFNAIDKFGCFVLFCSICKEIVSPVWRNFSPPL